LKLVAIKKMTDPNFPKDTKVNIEEDKDETLEEKSEVVLKLEALGQDPKNYLVTEDFAIYKGNNVDYKLIKRSFPKLVKEKLGVSETNAVKETKKIAVFLNLGGFSSTRKNVVKINKKAYTLDELTSKLEMINFSKTTAKTTDRKMLTLTRVCMAYADETREAIKLNPNITRFADLGDLGFVYSWACSGLTELEVRKIYIKQIDLVASWTPSRTSNPKRFPEKMEIYFTTILNYPKSFFEKIKEDYSKAKI
jgi:hypothetical protein